MTGAPLEPARVAQLVVTRGDGRHRGSGYLVRDDAVLTAAHVVEGADSVSVRFGPGRDDEWSVDTTTWWADPVSDVAVVTIEPRCAVEPARFGRIEDRAAVLTVEAVGFPLWKLRPEAAAKPYRDSVQAVGTVAVLSNWREGTLEVVVAPPAARDDDLSPWQGMSGSALWAGDRIVGVIAKHHPSDGPGRLAAARIDLALDRVDPAHGTPLRDVLAVPAPLPGVLPSPRPALISNAYQALVAEAAPEHLHDRKWELDELVRFCAGDVPYLWWQAGPWAGKSALLAWFAMHPPDGVDVVSFFITGRWAGQSDSDACTEALIEQLAALVGEPPELAMEARARRGHTLRLLNTAAARCAEAGRTLLLVVDGLDEDTSRNDGFDRPSIASLLPRRPPPGARVLVASRPHPGLPDDVPGDHPLRTVEPRPLTPSPYARNLEGAAKSELTTLLAKPGLQRDVLGLITASGGGLTQSDLEELTGQPAYELEAMFGGMLGRSVGARASRDQDERVYLFTHDTLREQAERKYGTGLNTYRAQLHEWADGYRSRGWPEDTPAYLLRGYHLLLAARGDVDRLVACALDRQRHDRMLALTGGDALALTEIDSAAGLLTRASEPDLYTLLRVAAARSQLSARNVDIPVGLPGVWAQLGRADRAVALAESLSEQRRAEALVKIIATLCAQGDYERVPQLADDVEREVERDGTRYQVLVRLAGTLAGGQEDERSRRIIAELEAAVPQMESSHGRDDLLVDLARHAVVRGDHERALAHLAAISAGYKQPQVFAELPLEVEDEVVLRYAMAVREPYNREVLLWPLAYQAQADPDRALRFLNALNADDDGVEIEDHLRTLSTEAVAAGDDDRAVRYAIAAEQPDQLLSDLFDQLADAGELERAARLAEEIGEPQLRANTLSWLALAHTEIGDPASAVAFAEAATALVDEVEEPDEQAGALARLAVVALARGDTGRAAELNGAADEKANQVGDVTARAHVLCWLATIATFGGDHDRYAELADEVETLARQPADSEERFDLLCALAGAAASAEDRARARRLAEAAASLIDAELTRPDRWDLDVQVINIAAAIGAPDLVPGLLASDPEAQGLRSLLEAALAEGDDDRAREIVNLVAGRSFPFAPAEVLTCLAQLGEDDLALEVVASNSGSTYDNNRYLASAAEVAAAAGDDDRALRLVGAVTWSYDRGKACETIAMRLDAAGQFDRVARYLGAIEGDFRRDEALKKLAWAAGGRGDLDRALWFLDQVTSSSERAAGVTALAELAAASGNADRAETLCVAAEQIARADASVEVLGGARLTLVNVLASADLDRAERLVRATVLPELREQAIGELALRVLECGDVARARRLAEEAAETERQNYPWWLYRRLMDVLVRTGAVEAAERVVAELETAVTTCNDDFDRERLQEALVEALAAVGRHAEALAQLDSGGGHIGSGHELALIARASPEGTVLADVRARLLSLVDTIRQRQPIRYRIAETIAALAAIGEHDAVLGLLQVELDPAERAEVLRALLEAVPEDPERRRELFALCEAETGKITEVFHRDWVLKDLAVARDEQGDHGEALRLAALVTDPVMHDNLQRDLELRAIVAGREVAGARRYVAEVLASEAWAQALAAVGKVDLPALQRFADDVLG